VPAITGIRSGHGEWQPEDQPDLPYAERSLSFQFAALGSNSDRTRFRYRMLGAEDEWIETGETGVRFAALPAGDYVFEVSAQDANGVWNDQPAKFHFSIHEPWWKTHYFEGGMFLLVAFVGRFFWSLRVKALVAQQERLQRVINQQTAELREQHRQLESIAYLDQLTSLPNRRMFTHDVRGRMETSSREGGTFALLLIDLDRFKHVNDTYGHDAGDAVLIATADRLRSSLRVRDSIARLGGDEFAILLGEQVEFEVVERICARIVRSCCDPVFFGEQRLEIGCSIGIAVFPADGHSEAELCKAADIALYSVKRTTRNHFSWFGLTEAFGSQ
jgi:diguanylate cyclase (GGDEF)-like protein